MRTEGEPYIHPTAEIEPGVTIGAHTRIWHLCHIRRGAVIGRDCVLGRNVFVDHHVNVGAGVHIGNNVSVFHGVALADGVFVGPHVTFTNDRHPRAGNLCWKPESTRVGEGASIGAGATILCGITIGAGAIIACGATVLRDVEPREVYREFGKGGRRYLGK